MKRSVHAFTVLVLLAAACSEPPPPPRAAAKARPDPALQPRLEPRPQVVIPAPPRPAVLQAKPQPPADENRALAERVRRALEEESRIHAAAIDVTAAGGTVTLWGTATSNDERIRATRVASRIAGVKWVDNRIVIGPSS